MNDTTFTFSTAGSQSPVELIEDPSKPTWEDLLSATESAEENIEESDLPHPGVDKS